jgi:anti-sigma regulatory factor (Ser/Thr protein kinase)
MDSDADGLSIALPARAENVSVVRHLLAGFGREHGMGEPGIGDLMTVVTEACMNVVAHAYRSGDGRLQVEALPRRGALTVSVRDFGAGIRPHADFEGTGGRLGLALIAALTESFEIRHADGGGTEMRMRMPIAGKPAH